MFGKGSYLIVQVAVFYPLVHAIIEGPIPDVGYSKYSAAILSCQSVLAGDLSDYTKYCQVFCSGTLIAPDVVLTAGHCVESKDSPFKNPQPVYPLDTTYVVLGTTDITMSNGKIVGVKSVVNLGFGRNKAYVTDNDIGLIFLSECVEAEPGVIDFAKVATLSTEPNGVCPIVSSMGFGLNANIPSSIAVNTGKLRYSNDILHPFSVCQSSYAQILVQLRGYPSDILENPFYDSVRDFYYSQIVPEMNLCAGGNSAIYAICHGDSGGPLLDSNTVKYTTQVIGVNSFGIASNANDDFCGWGPDYSSRVAFHAAKIRDTISEHSQNCADWNITDVFSDWPVRELRQYEYSSEFNTTRCTDANQWQCMNGNCISLDSVCNHVNDCGSDDASDEDVLFCSVVYSILTPTASAEAELRLGGDIDVSQNLNSKIEFEIALEKYFRVVDVIQSDDRPAEIDTAVPPKPYVVIGYGTEAQFIHFPELPWHLNLTLPETITTKVTKSPAAHVDEPVLILPPMNFASIPPKYTSIVANVSSIPCFGIVTYINTVNQAEIREGLNRAEFDPNYWTGMCQRYIDCAISDVSIDSFCSEWTIYLSNRSRQANIANVFNSQFNTTCALPYILPYEVPLNFSLITPATTTPAPTRTNPIPTSVPSNSSDYQSFVNAVSTTISPSNSTPSTDISAVKSSGMINLNVLLIMTIAILM